MILKEQKSRRVTKQKSNKIILNIICVFEYFPQHSEGATKGVL